MDKASAGGKAAAANMTKEERKDRAKKGAAARKANKELPTVTHGNSETPLMICGITIPCYVLSDTNRLIFLIGPPALLLSDIQSLHLRAQ